MDGMETSRAYKVRTRMHRIQICQSFCAVRLPRDLQKNPNLELPKTTLIGVYGFRVKGLGETGGSFGASIFRILGLRSGYIPPDATQARTLKWHKPEQSRFRV